MLAHTNACEYAPIWLWLCDHHPVGKRAVAGGPSSEVLFGEKLWWDWCTIATAMELTEIEKAATSTNELAREQQKILKACYNTCNDVHIFSSLPPLRSPTHRRYMPKSWTFVQNVCSYITLLDTRCDHLLYASTPWVVCYALACPVSCLIGTLRASEVAQPRLHTMWYINCCCCGICCSKTSFWDLTIC